MHHNSSPCAACDRLAIDYEQTLAEHADFVIQYAAAVRAHQHDTMWNLKVAMQGSELFWRMAKERLDAHRATHREYNAA